jgi:hypothetical protein
MQPLASCRPRIDGVLAAGVDSSCLAEGGSRGGFAHAGRTSEFPLFGVLRARGVDDRMSFTFFPPFLSDLLVTQALMAFSRINRRLSTRRNIYVVDRGRAWHPQGRNADQ